MYPVMMSFTMQHMTMIIEFLIFIDYGIHFIFPKGVILIQFQREK